MAIFRSRNMRVVSGWMVVCSRHGRCLYGGVEPLKPYGQL
jgi:hypothetical protein